MTPIRNCDIPGCDSLIRHDKLFCIRHFRMLPGWCMDALLYHYTPGQDRGDVKPTPQWYHAVQEAVYEISRAEKLAAR